MTTEITLIELVTAQKGAAGGEGGLQRKQEEQAGQQPGTGLTKRDTWESTELQADLVWIASRA